MTRYRVTVRGTGIELRGYVDQREWLDRLSDGLANTEESDPEGPDPMIVASPASADYDPYARAKDDRDALLELADAMDEDRYPGSDLVRAAADR